jgi:hypothetical protein
MKARKSRLAEQLLADPAAREQLRDFMGAAKHSARVGNSTNRSEAVVLRTADGRRVVPRLVTPKLVG